MRGTPATAEQKTTALARLHANGGNIKRTARELGITDSTLRTWRDLERAHADGRKVAANAPDRVRDIALAWQDVERRAIKAINRGLEDALDPDLPFKERPRLHDISYAARVATDSHLDHRDGRKGAEIRVDARQQSLALPAGASLDDVKALLADIREPPGSDGVGIYRGQPPKILDHLQDDPP